jgi:hypothetical protein
MSTYSNQSRRRAVDRLFDDNDNVQVVARSKNPSTISKKKLSCREEKMRAEVSYQTLIHCWHLWLSSRGSELVWH